MSVEGTRAILVLRVGATRLGLDPALVAEITEPSAPTPVPGAPDYLLGLVNLRGSAVPVIDLQRFLELPSAQTADEAFPRVLVVQSGGMRVGWSCDRVIGVSDVPVAQIGPVRLSASHRVGGFATAEIDGDDGAIAILDVDQVLAAARPADAR